MGFLKTLIKKIDRFLNPNKYLFSDEEKAAMVEARDKRNLAKRYSPKQMVEQNILGVFPEEVTYEMDKESAIDNAKLGDADDLFYYRSDRKLQLVVKFKPHSAKRYQYRDDKQRKTLKPIIAPKRGKKPYDRTHLIPIGYHGSENNPLLVIGWDSVQNRGEIEQFERRIAKINQTETIIWFVDLTYEVDKTVSWDVWITNQYGKPLLDNHFHDASEFFWSTRVLAPTANPMERTG